MQLWSTFLVQNDPAPVFFFDITKILCIHFIKVYKFLAGCSLTVRLGFRLPGNCWNYAEISLDSWVLVSPGQFYACLMIIMEGYKHAWHASKHTHRLYFAFPHQNKLREYFLWTFFWRDMCLNVIQPWITAVTQDLPENCHICRKWPLFGNVVICNLKPSFWV